ncbi:T9SS-dependent choice-of-anchor J family protein [Winogradskyella jejuensis]|uniref:Por secretion system C-terminal sorting domain-containing protein n=1 Tax=Winogradskyella jejuensis TaxID=1089305 RepID=A0A1M5SDM0_9FLAO|nr:choice-of-anchor J domain-containing protein [Winogradskyella jejuensis]SHH36569.1 Por secretion system C-terminal sorting domain-containing protein [Winogradskyella jejuensis]
MKTIILGILLLLVVTGLQSQTTIIEEGFESGIFPPTGWATFRGVDDVGPANDWTTSTDAYTGNLAAFSRYANSNIGVAEDWLVTPLIDLTNASNTVLSFFSKENFNTEYASRYDVRISTISQTTHADFSTIATYSDFTLDYEQIIINLSAYDGQQIYIAFVHIDEYQDDWLLDDISILSDSECQIGYSKPTYLSAGRLLGQSFTAECTGSLEYVQFNTPETGTVSSNTLNIFEGNGTSGNLIYTEVFPDINVTTINDDIRVYLVDELNVVEGHQYTFQFYVDNLLTEYSGSSTINPYPGGSSINSNGFPSPNLDRGFEVSIKGLLCFPPEDILVTSITDVTATILWTSPNSNADTFDVLLMASGDNPETETPLFSETTTGNATSIEFTSLILDTTYDVYVVSQCENSSSLYSPVISFTTNELPTPINDSLCDTIMITMNTNSSGGAYYNNYSSTEANELAGSCYADDVSNHSVWFSFVAPASGEVQINTRYPDGTLTDSQLLLYDVLDCTNLATATLLACDEDDDANIDENGAPQYNALIEYSGLTAGETYYISVDGYSGQTGSFDIGVFDRSTLSTNQIETNNVLKVYPNPTEDYINILNLNTQENYIIYDVLGKQVSSGQLLRQSQILVSHLDKGIYFLKLDNYETLRFIKN